MRSSVRHSTYGAEGNSFICIGAKVDVSTLSSVIITTIETVRASERLATRESSTRNPPEVSTNGDTTP